MAKQLKVGQRVGGWIVSEAVGLGGNARVYRVQSANDGTVAALKTLYRNTVESEARFRRECQLTRSLPIDENLIKIVDVAADGDPLGLWYAMEFINGPTLQADRARFAGQLEMSLELMEKVSVAVGKLHVAGIVHRDLKPDNILLRAPDVPVVLDFGLCWLRDFSTERLTPDERATGAWGFRAPEHEHARVEEVSETADVFSLTKILWWLLHGGPPFAAAHWEGDVHDLARKHNDARMHAVHTLMRKVIVPDPANRSVRSGAALASEIATIRAQLHSPSSGRVSAATAKHLAARNQQRAAFEEHKDREERLQAGFPALRKRLHDAAELVAEEARGAMKASGDDSVTINAINQLADARRKQPNCVALAVGRASAYLVFYDAHDSSTGRALIMKQVVMKCQANGVDISSRQGLDFCGKYALDLVGDETVLVRAEGNGKGALVEPSALWERVYETLIQFA